MALHYTVFTHEIAWPPCWYFWLLRIKNQTAAARIVSVWESGHVTCLEGFTWRQSECLLLVGYALELATNFKFLLTFHPLFTFSRSTQELLNQCH